MKPIRLGVNIDHVATLRNARGEGHPDVLRAAEAVQRAGADLITIHLREDRRHIHDADVEQLISWRGLPINLEMAATDAMHAIALRTRPDAVCLVPEKREELTTEGGLNVAAHVDALTKFIRPLQIAGIAVAVFIDASGDQVEAARQIGADAIELHTGTYAKYFGQDDTPLTQLRICASMAASMGLRVHAGHGLTFENVKNAAAIPEIEELNIGHFLIGEALFTGLEPAITHMHQLMREAR